MPFDVEDLARASLVRILPRSRYRLAAQTDARFGGWGYGRKARPDLSNAQFAIEALHDAGLKPGDPAYKAALVFLSLRSSWVLLS